MRRHSERDKNMKGYTDHAAVERRAPLPGCAVSTNKRNQRAPRRHGGFWCVHRYVMRWWMRGDEVCFMVVSVPDAEKSMRSLLSTRRPETAGPDTYYGLESGWDYHTARSNAKEMERQESLVKR